MMLDGSIKLLKLLINLIRDYSRVVLIAFIIRNNSACSSKRLQYGIYASRESSGKNPWIKRISFIFAYLSGIAL